ncbi:MAG TPA: hypothetical protein VIR56_08810 [Solimonas sp.]
MSRTLALCQLSAAAVLTALSCTPAHAEIYHCIVDGVPKFSDKPCHAGDAPVAVPDVTVVPAQKADSLTMQHDARVQQYQKARAEEDAAWGDEYAARLANEARIRDARQRDEIVAGMTADDVRHLRGEPQRISTRKNARGEVETWSYKDSEHGSVTVTLQNDAVVNVRSSKTRSAR